MTTYTLQYIEDRLQELLKEGTILPKTFDERLEEGEVEAHSTGQPLLDDKLGIGGFPVGGVSTIFGEPASGKTTLAVGAICAAIEDHKIAAVFDMDLLHVDFWEPLQRRGVLVAQSMDPDEVLHDATLLARTSAVGLIVIESFQADPLLCSYLDQELPSGERYRDFIDPELVKVIAQRHRKLEALISSAKASGTSLIFTVRVRREMTQHETWDLGSHALTDPSHVLVGLSGCFEDMRATILKSYFSKASEEAIPFTGFSLRAYGGIRDEEERDP